MKLLKANTQSVAVFRFVGYVPLVRFNFGWPSNS